MCHQPHLELADCRSIAAASHLAADQHQARVSIAIVDAGGHLLLLERRDGSSPASAEAAIAKARMAALNGKPTAAMEASINAERPALLQEDSCLGAIGVSGMTPDVDSAVAAAGLTALPR